MTRFLEQLGKRRVQMIIGGEHIAAFQHLGAAFHVGDVAAGLAHQQDAGSDIPGLHSFAPDEFLKLMATNTLGPLLLARALRPNLVTGRMRTIANIGSRAGSMAEGLLDDYDDDYAYRCSKAALNMVCAQLAQDLRVDGIMVLSLHPGWAKTDMGGDHAVLAVEDSARGLRTVIDSATPRDSGSFQTFDGIHIEW